MKKIFLMALSVCLVAALSIGGTLAYLTSEDSDVNVMTLGNVKIKQHEFERVVDANGNYTTIDVAGTNSYELKEFSQGKPLYPIVGDPNDGYDSTEVRLAQLGHNSRGGMSVLPEANVQDKFVVVENTGKSDAYVRTIVAFEAGSVAEEDWYKLVNYSSHFTWKETQDWFVTEIDGNNYYCVEFVYNGYQDIQHPNGVLPPGDYTYNNLAQVYLYSHATNEDCEALDGNNNGLYDILVLSQAIQTAGFEDAKTALDTGFGAFNETNVKVWFDGKSETFTGGITCHADTKAVRGLDGSYFVANDFSSENIIFFGDGTSVELDLNGKTITAGKPDQYLFGAQNGAKLTLDGAGTVEAGKGFMTNKGNAEIVINDGTYNMTVTSTLSNIKHTSFAQNNSKIVINGGTFTTDVNDAALFFATSNGIIEVNGGFFENTADDTPDLFSMGTNKGNTNRIIFKGGTFVNWNPLEDKMCYTGEWPASYEQFSGPHMLVWDGYTVVSETQANGDVWYSVVPK